MNFYVIYRGNGYGPFKNYRKAKEFCAELLYELRPIPMIPSPWMRFFKKGDNMRVVEPVFIILENSEEVHTLCALLCLKGISRIFDPHMNVDMDLFRKTLAKKITSQGAYWRIYKELEQELRRFYKNGEL